MLVVRERPKVSGCRIVCIIIAEDKAITHPIVVTVFDNFLPGLDNDELFKVKLRAIDKTDSAIDGSSGRRPFLEGEGRSCNEWGSASPWREET